MFPRPIRTIGCNLEGNTIHNGYISTSQRSYFALGDVQKNIFFEVEKNLEIAAGANGAIKHGASAEGVSVVRITRRGDTGIRSPVGAVLSEAKGRRASRGIAAGADGATKARAPKA